MSHGNPQTPPPRLGIAARHHPAPRRRRDGWTGERRALFLDRLAAGDDVRRAAAIAGMSREGAYRLRRRDGDFAREWQVAQRSARLAAEDGWIALLPDGLRAAMERLASRV